MTHNSAVLGYRNTSPILPMVPGRVFCGPRVSWTLKVRVPFLARRVPDKEPDSGADKEGENSRPDYDASPVVPAHQQSQRGTCENSSDDSCEKGQARYQGEPPRREPIPCKFQQTHKGHGDTPANQQLSSSCPVSTNHLGTLTLFNT